MLKNITIRRKLLISFVSMTIFIMLLSFLSLIFLVQVRDENRNLYIHPFTVSNATKQVELDLRTIQTKMMQLVYDDTIDDTSILIQDVQDLETEVEEKLVLIRENYLGNMADVTLLERNYETSKSKRLETISYVELEMFEEAQDSMLSYGPQIREDIYTQTSIIHAFAENKAIELRSNVEFHTRNYITSLIIFSLALVSLTVFLFLTIMKDIYPPIDKLIETIEGQKEGKDINTLHIDRKDEIGIVSKTLNDMIDHIKTQQELKELSIRLENAKNQELLRVTLRSIGEALISTDLDGEILDINNVAENLTGYSKKEAIGANVMTILNVQYAYTEEKIVNILSRKHQKKFEVDTLNLKLISKSNKTYDIAVSMSQIADEEKNAYGYVLIFRDITEDVARQKEIKFLSENDILTKLRNRNYLEKKLLELEESQSLNIGIIMGDVNGLKIANDAFGHYFGDQLLIQIAEILVKTTQDKEATIVRWGGDEFVIVLEQIQKEDLEELCRIIRYEADNYKTTNPVAPNISLGYSLKEKDDQNLYRALIRAEDMMYENKLLEKNSTRSKIVSTLENSLYEKSFETEEHALRVASFSVEIGKYLGLNNNEINQLQLLGKLHDIGKISIDDSILTKPGKLDNSEWNTIRKHPETGYRIASSLNELTHIAEGILNHHEHYDGSGYPRGISGKDIPLSSRIIAVADAYDVMTTKRPYNKTLAKETACKELMACSGTQFDPDIVKVFVEKVCKV